MTDYVLWGFSARQPEPIKLTGGSLAHCQSAQRSRVAQGWTCAIHYAGTTPTGLRLQATERGDN